MKDIQAHDDTRNVDHPKSASPANAQQPHESTPPGANEPSKSVVRDALSSASPQATEKDSGDGGVDHHDDEAISSPPPAKENGQDGSKVGVRAAQEPQDAGEGKESEKESECLQTPDVDAEGKGAENKDESPEVLLRRLQERVGHLEKQMKDRASQSDTVSGSDTDADADETKGDRDKRQPVVPKLQFVDWQEFKHKYVSQQETYAIEVLAGLPRYYYQRAEDMKEIQMSREKASDAQLETVKVEPTSAHTSSPKELPERIRINSRSILAILKQIDDGEVWGVKSAVILRPYKPFVHFERQIREAFSRLEDRWGEAERLENAPHQNLSETTEKTRLGKSEKADDIVPITSSDKDSIQDTEQSDVPLSKADEISNASEIVASSRSTSDPDEKSVRDQVDSKQEDTVIVSTSHPSRFETKNDEIHNNVENRTGDAQRLPSEADVRAEDSSSSARDKPNANGNEEDHGPGPRSKDQRDDATKTADGEGAEEEPESLTDSVNALRDFRCLIEFIDKILQPVVERIKSGSYTKIYFSDLWHLYKPGEIMYAPLGGKSEADVAFHMDEKTAYIKKPNDRIQEVWKIMTAAHGRPQLRAKEDGDLDSVGSNVRFVDLSVLASYYDFNGSSFVATTYQHCIRHYEGEQEITSLPFYPLRFAPNREELSSKWLERGQSFMSFVTPKHRYYSGRSLICRPNGSRPEQDDLPKHVENIDSQVIIDFAETIAENPGWSPLYYVSTMLQAVAREYSEDYPIMVWKDRRRKVSEGRRNDRIYYDRRIDEKMMDQEREKDPLTKDGPDKISGDAELSKEALMLLPNRVFAFVMKNRKFAMLTVDGIRDIKSYEDGFRDLKLPGKHKTMVSSLVHNHFNNKKFELEDRQGSHDSDIVRGKGKGLIMLLHGAPGVGKTSTAETVAEAYRKPLFPITCGDLGLTADKVESELSEIFHLAELWDCVLLLDEADVFLAQRTRTDISRNSLVSVFLRVLEYFTGILFLTTNRVGAFDEAFKSRIHVSLYYPPLDWNQTVAIWEMNMGRLREKKRRREERFNVDEQRLYMFARQHYKENRPRNAHWNGRQIRNAFQTAIALAEFEAHEARSKAKKAKPEIEPPPVEPDLKVEHFETVAVASAEFDDYLYKLRGKSDSSRAFFDQERADQYESVPRSYTRRIQQSTGDSQGMPPPPPMQPGMPSAQTSRAQRPLRSQQQYPRQQQGYTDEYTDSFNQDDVLSEEENPKYGQTWQEPLGGFIRSDRPVDEDSWRREPSPPRQSSRNQSARQGGQYQYNPDRGFRDY